MKRHGRKLFSTALPTLPLAVLAEPWKDESGHGSSRGDDQREFKESYRDGNCKVERK